MVFLVFRRVGSGCYVFRPGLSLLSFPSVLVIAAVEVTNMITLDIFACRFLIILGIGAVWVLLAIGCGKFCASNNQP